MNKVKFSFIATFMTFANMIMAGENEKTLTVAQDIDANAVREAIGMDAVTVIPLLTLVVFLGIMYFAVQRIPGLKS